MDKVDSKVNHQGENEGTIEMGDAGAFRGTQVSSPRVLKGINEEPEALNNEHIILNAEKKNQEKLENMEEYAKIVEKSPAELSERIFTYLNTFYNPGEKFYLDFTKLIGAESGAVNWSFLEENTLNLQILLILLYHESHRLICEELARKFEGPLRKHGLASFGEKSLDNFIAKFECDMPFLNKYIEWCLESKTFYLTSKILTAFNYSAFSDIKKELFEKIIANKMYEFLDVIIKKGKKKHLILDKKAKTLRGYLIDHLLKQRESGTKEAASVENSIILELLQKKCCAVLKIILKHGNGITLSVAMIKKFISHAQYELILVIIKQSTAARDLIMTEEIFCKIIKKLKKEDHFIHIIHLLYRIKLHKLSPYCLYLIGGKFEKILEKKRQLYLNFIIPLIPTVVTAVIFLRLSRTFPSFKNKFSLLAIKYRELAIDLHSKVEDSLHVKYILFSEIYPLPRRKIAFDLLLHEKKFFVEILIKSSIVETVQRKWSSSYLFNNDIMACSTAKQLLTNFNKTLNKDESNARAAAKKTLVLRPTSLLQSKNFSPLKLVPPVHLNEAIKTNHIYQLVIYNHSVSFRILIEFFFYLIMFSAIFYNLMLYLDIAERLDHMGDDLPNMLLSQMIPPRYAEKIMQNVMSYQKWKATGVNTTQIFLPVPLTDDTSWCYNTLLVTSQTKELYDEYLNDCIFMKYALFALPDLMPSLKLSFYFIMFLASFTFLREIYYYLIYRKFWQSYAIPRDIILLAVSIFCTYTADKLGKSSMTTDLWRVESPSIKFSCVITIFILWIRFVEYIKMTQSLGVLIKIIQLMFKDLITFLIILFTVILSFGSIFYILYRSNFAAFSSLYLNFRQMVTYVLGSFEFYNVGSDFNTVSSSVLTVIFVVLTNIVLINLLVAIFSNTFSVVISQSNIEYASILYISYKSQKHHKRLGAIMVYPPPFSVVGFGIFPFAVFLNSERFSRGILRIGYLPIFFFFCCLFSFIDLFFIIPLAYVRLLVSFIFGNMSTFHLSSRRKVITIITWVFLGLPRFYYIHFTNDLPNFVRSSFMSKDNREKMKNVSYFDYKILKKICRKAINENQPVMPTKDFFDLFKKYLMYCDVSIDERAAINSGFNHALAKNRNSVVSKTVIKQADVMSIKGKLEMRSNQAKKFLAKFSVKNKIDCSLLMKNIEIIKRKNRRSVSFSRKKYMHLLDLINREENLSLKK